MILNFKIILTTDWFQFSILVIEKHERKLDRKTWKKTRPKKCFLSVFFWTSFPHYSFPQHIISFFWNRYLLLLLGLLMLFVMRCRWTNKYNLIWSSDCIFSSKKIHPITNKVCISLHENHVIASFHHFPLSPLHLVYISLSFSSFLFSVSFYFLFLSIFYSSRSLFLLLKVSASHNKKVHDIWVPVSHPFQLICSPEYSCPLSPVSLSLFLSLYLSLSLSLWTSLMDIYNHENSIWFQLL